MIIDLCISARISTTFTTKNPPPPNRYFFRFLKLLGLNASKIIHFYLVEGNHWHEAISPLDSPALNTDASSGPAQDCRTAHQSAIESTRSGVPNAFIPECDANDNYKPVQCYKVR
jgi:hypothetical protein